MRSAQLLLRVQVGTISDVRFQNVTCTAEAGIVVAGSVDATIEGLVLENVGIELVQQTDYSGATLLVPAHALTSAWTPQQLGHPLYSCDASSHKAPCCAIKLQIHVLRKRLALRSVSASRVSHC